MRPEAKRGVKEVQDHEKDKLSSRANFWWEKAILGIREKRERERDFTSIFSGRFSKLRTKLIFWPTFAGSCGARRASPPVTARRPLCHNPAKSAPTGATVRRAICSTDPEAAPTTRAAFPEETSTICCRKTTRTEQERRLRRRWTHSVMARWRHARWPPPYRSH